jgi:hypothetical protein
MMPNSSDGITSNFSSTHLPLAPTPMMTLPVPVPNSSPTIERAPYQLKGPILVISPTPSPMILHRPAIESHGDPMPSHLTAKWKCSEKAGVSKFLCQTISATIAHNSSIGAVIILLLLLLCCCYSCYFLGSRRRDDRGEYRAVAARFGKSDDNAFDDASSDGSFFDDEDFEDHWPPNQRMSLEMISQERNGGLTLEEMNG